MNHLRFHCPFIALPKRGFPSLEVYQYARTSIKCTFIYSLSRPANRPNPLHLTQERVCHTALHYKEQRSSTIELHNEHRSRWPSRGIKWKFAIGQCRYSNVLILNAIKTIDSVAIGNFLLAIGRWSFCCQKFR